MSQCMLTTIDNEFNPFTQYDTWLAFDSAHGYNTPGVLAYFAIVSSDMDEDEYNEAVSDAIDDVLSTLPFGLYMKVYDYEADVLIPLANKAYQESIANETVKE